MCEIINTNLKQKENERVWLTPYHEYNVLEDGKLWETRVNGYAAHCKHGLLGEWELTPVLKDGQYLKVPKNSWITIKRMV